MYNFGVRQEQNAPTWEDFLVRSKEMLAKARSKKRRKELLFSVRAFETLIRQNAPMPKPQKAVAA